MVFLGLLVKYMFITILLVAIFFIGIIVYFFIRVRNLSRAFGEKTQAGGHRTSTAGFGQGGSQGHKTAGGGATGGNGSTAGSGTFVNEELYDQRSPREANRKIFKKDEGEYVDFEETK